MTMSKIQNHLSPANIIMTQEHKNIMPAANKFVKHETPIPCSQPHSASAQKASVPSVGALVTHRRHYVLLFLCHKENQWARRHYVLLFLCHKENQWPPVSLKKMKMRGVGSGLVPRDCLGLSFLV